MKAPRPSRRSRDPRAALGRAGEAAVTGLYADAGFTVVARNLRTTHGELDLVVRQRDLLVAVEVKTRRNHGAPERLVDDTELARRAAALDAVAAVLAPDLRRPRLRVDVVAVRWFDESPPELRAFRGPERRGNRGPPQCAPGTGAAAGAGARGRGERRTDAEFRRTSAAVQRYGPTMTLAFWKTRPRRR